MTTGVTHRLFSIAESGAMVDKVYEQPLQARGALFCVGPARFGQS